MSDVRAPSPATIERCVSAWQRAKHALEADEELANDEAVLALAMASDPHALPPDEMIRRFAAAIVFAEARAAEAKTIKQSLNAREMRYASRAMVLRAELLEIMQALRHKSFSAPHGTVYVRQGTPSAVVLDLEALPDEYVRTKREADKHKLLTDLKQGLAIDGAALSNSMPTLALRQDKLADNNSVADEE